MYKVTVWRKHLIQVELDNTEQVDLIRRTFVKLMVWSDPPMFPLQEGMKFGFMAYTTKENLKHMFDLVGITKDYAYNDPNAHISPQFQPKWVSRLYYDRKFVKKKMSRKNYLSQFYDSKIPDWVLIWEDPKKVRKRARKAKAARLAEKSKSTK